MIEALIYKWSSVAGLSDSERVRGAVEELAGELGKVAPVNETQDPPGVFDVIEAQHGKQARRQVEAAAYAALSRSNQTQLEKIKDLSLDDRLAKLEEDVAIYALRGRARWENLAARLARLEPIETLPLGHPFVSRGEDLDVTGCWYWHPDTRKHCSRPPADHEPRAAKEDRQEPPRPCGCAPGDFVEGPLAVGVQCRLTKYVGASATPGTGGGT